METLVQTERRGAVYIRVLEEDGRVAIGRDDELHALVVPSVGAVAKLGFHAELGETIGGAFVQADDKGSSFDCLEAGLVGRARRL